jgi:hypothetical protein
MGTPAGGNPYLWLQDAAFTAAVLLGMDPLKLRVRVPGSPPVYYPAGVCPMGHTLSDSPVTFLRDGAYIFDRDDHFEVVVQALDWFGGDTGNGGVGGTIDVYPGSLTQEPSAYLEAHEVNPIPAYLGVCYAVAKRFYWGNSPYIPEIAFVISRYPNTLGLTGGDQRIGDDANPACMIYELLTNTRWGLSIPTTAIATQSFLDAGATLADEGRGLSMVLDTATAATSILEEIMRYIDGLLYTDPFTGLLTLKLARADYDPGDLPVLDESNVLTCSLTRPSRGGVLAVEEVPLLGISNAPQAQLAAARILKALAYPFATLKLEVNRESWSLRPGSVCKLNWPRLGIVGMVLRISGLASGTLEEGKLTVGAVEDIFAVDWTAYAPVPAPGWVNPSQLPAVSRARRLEELWFALLGTDDIGIAAMCVAGVGTMLGFEVWSDPAGGEAYTLTNVVDRGTPYGTLQAALGPGVADSLVLENAVDCDRLVAGAWGVHLLLVDDELIAWLAPTVNEDGTVTLSGLARGVCDTAPKAHLLGTPVFLVTDGYGLTDPEPYTADLTVTARLAPFNGTGKISPSAEPEVTLATTSRATRPYCPTDLKLNDEAYPATAARPVVLTWEHRDRDADPPWNYAESGKVPALATGVQYRVKAYNAYGTVVDEQTTTGKTVTLNYSASIDVVAVRIYAEVVAGGLLSHDYLLWEGTIT